MGNFSTFLKNKILDHICNGTSYSAPGTLYVALFTANPTNAGGGTEVSTSNWTNYARIGKTANTTNFPAASAGAVSNGTIVDFGTAATTGNQTITGFGIYDASTAGNLLMWHDLSPDVVVQNGNPVSIAVGDLDISATDA